MNKNKKSNKAKNNITTLTTSDLQKFRRMSEKHLQEESKKNEKNKILPDPTPGDKQAPNKIDIEAEYEKDNKVSESPANREDSHHPEENQNKDLPLTPAPTVEVNHNALVSKIMTGVAKVMASNNLDITSKLMGSMTELNSKTQDMITLKLDRNTDAILGLEEKMLNENKKLEDNL